MASYACSVDSSGRYLLVVRVAADVFFPNPARLPWARTTINRYLLEVFFDVRGVVRRCLCEGARFSFSSVTSTRT